nr:P-loop NTPase fold protein [uncultured Porphyromonas sp.]
MSPNKAPQNQNASSPIPSQEPGPKPKVPSLQEAYRATSEPKTSCLKEAYKAASSLLRKCWSKRRALPKFIRWKFPSIVECIFGILAESRVPIVLWVLFVFLHKPIEEFAVELLVTPVLAHFNTGWLSSLVALGLALAFVRYTFLLGRRRYIVGGKVVLSAFLVLLGYCYYRFFRPDFKFYGLFDKACPIAFAYLIPLACLAPLGLRLWTCCTKCQARQKEQATESVEGFLTDHPLTEEEEELSGWTSQAQTLTQKLLATDTTRAAFSLGIVASWGEGKSSFMGIMQRYLQQAQREVIVMRFNPWLYDKEAQLTKVFFEELRRTLAPYSSKLSKSIDNYADLLLAVDSSWLKLAHELLRLSQRSTTEQFDKLSRDIKELGRKVVIFIDDVDRLTREELMELFNLVRNSSNLPCLYFVLAYDKSYVLKTLQSDGEHMSRYPEKILQEEYPLPKLTPDKMWVVLERCLNETQFGKEDKDKLSILLVQLEDKTLNLPYHLTTIRMVKRMVNAFNSRYELLHSLGVNARDLFIFELIYYVYPSVYDYLKEMHQTHTNYTIRETPSIWDTANNRVFLRQGWQQILSQNLFERGHCSYSSIDQQQIELLISTLWSGNRKRRAPQINDFPSLGRYFYRSPLAQDILEADFLSFLRLDREGKAAWMDHQTFLPTQESFIHLLKDHLDTRLENAKEVIWAELYWNSINSIRIDGQFYPPSKEYLFLGQDIERAVSESRQALLRRFKEALETFFSDASLIPGLWIYIISWLEQSTRTSAIFTQDELFEKLTLLFKEIVRGNNVSVLYSYWVFLKIVLKPDLHTHFEELTTIMREQAQRDLTPFLSCSVIQRRDNYGGLAYTLRPIPWESRQELQQILEGSAIGEGDMGKRYLNFLKKLGDQEFVHIPKEEAPIVYEWDLSPRS